ncbi:hypothetical protein H6P81_002123 [Aristolochia fimbriata]|uniref:Gag-pol polyprotein n=1 Tax=Aristolochia fimbriata TaxID=158543 RepID=A0AAV7FBR1_ARIFI|nr:hypothetical protein H6P81_002123 [Aristolochia fimbriata]
MRVFIRAVDEKVWDVVLEGWTPPTVVDAEGKVTPKPRELWTAKEDKLSSYNASAINAIMCGVNTEHFKLIAACESAKEAWTILQTHFEGTKAVRFLKLQMLTTRFETLRMGEEESIAEFFAKIQDIRYESIDLGERIPENELVRKVLRSLPKKFAYKVIAIKENRIIDDLKLDDLMWSLRAFEMTLNV